jgi:glycosyltransferase involved in cell wall biosynthesis
VSDGGELRLLQVIQELTYGGAEQVVTALTLRLVAEGVSVAVAAAGESIPGAPGVRVQPLPLVERRPSRIPAAAWALRRAIREERPDVVHAHNPAMGLACAIATQRGRRPQALVTMHGVPEEDYGAAARVLRLAGLPVVACGPGVAAALAEHGVRVTDTIVNGVGPALPAVDPRALREELGLPPQVPLVLSVGRLVLQKNHALALRAIAAVPNVAYAVIGDGPLRGELEDLARSLGIADRVRFVGAREDARALIATADVLLLSSRWEGLPLVVLEALAAETPVVATAVRGVNELLADRDTASLVAPGDATGLAIALQGVLTDEAARQRLRGHGRRLAARYSEDAMTERYLALYETLRHR